VTRGSLVTVALKGEYGKPRPALIVQSRLFESHPSITVLPLTSELLDAPLLRIPVEPDGDNGLQARSQIMVDKIQSIPRSRIGNTIGRLSEREIVAVNRALAVFLGIA
jgi:mRNA interferase MazF